MQSALICYQSHILYVYGERSLKFSASFLDRWFYLCKVVFPKWVFSNEVIVRYSYNRMQIIWICANMMNKWGRRGLGTTGMLIIFSPHRHLLNSFFCNNNWVFLLTHPHSVLDQILSFYSLWWSTSHKSKFVSCF